VVGTARRGLEVREVVGRPAARGTDREPAPVGIPQERRGPSGARQPQADLEELVERGLGARGVGGGLPVGAYGGRADVMALVAPDGPVYQAGTLSGNPLAMAAGLATLRALGDTIYRRLEELGASLESGLADVASVAGVAVRITRIASLLTIFFDDDQRFARFFHGMLERGVMLPPSQHEAWFLSAAHGHAHLVRSIEAARAAFKEVAG
jgi:glutamate-1-semialdehyde 2,1-aminomutase